MSKGVSIPGQKCEKVKAQTRSPHAASVRPMGVSDGRKERNRKTSMHAEDRQNVATSKEKKEKKEILFC